MQIRIWPRTKTPARGRYLLDDCVKIFYIAKACEPTNTQDTRSRIALMHVKRFIPESFPCALRRIPSLFVVLFTTGLSCLWPSANRPADSATTQGRSSLPRSPRQSRHFVQVHFASDQREHLTPHLRYHLWSVQRFSERSSVRSHLLMRYARELHARRSDHAMQTTPKASASRRAGRRTVSLYFMKTRPFQTILALASGS